MSREWTKEEINTLKNMLGKYNVPTIAIKLNRTYEAVRIKLVRLGISNTKEHTGLITIGELSKLLKVERNTVKNWTLRHGLPYKSLIPNSTKEFYFIDPAEFWCWAKYNREKIQFSNIEKNSLPPELCWVDDERSKDKYYLKKNSYTKWTVKEETSLINLRSQGLSFKKIGEQMNRTTLSVERRYSRLKKSCEN